jgi:arginase
MQRDIQIINAPSILGLKPSGVQYLAEALLKNSLQEKLGSHLSPIQVPDLNHLYTNERDPETGCLNSRAIQQFSISLKSVVSQVIDKKHFPLVLGGDCSILVAAIAALKEYGEYGLIFIDAHADFYLSHQSMTGEVADMDLAIVTGNGPSMLSNINGLKPYVQEKNVIHVGQRDEEQAENDGSADIRESEIKCMSLAEIRLHGIEHVAAEILEHMNSLSAKGLWIHFDTDVLADEINPAVDYRLPGGLQFEEVEYLVRQLLATSTIAGMTVTIFNPLFDKTGNIAANITDCLARMFRASSQHAAF